jgi:hypothetical protein
MYARDNCKFVIDKLNSSQSMLMTLLYLLHDEKYIGTVSGPKL